MRRWGLHSNFEPRLSFSGCYRNKGNAVLTTSRSRHRGHCAAAMQDDIDMLMGTAVSKHNTVTFNRNVKSKYLTTERTQSSSRGPRFIPSTHGVAHNYP